MVTQLYRLIWLFFYLLAYAYEKLHWLVLHTISFWSYDLCRSQATIISRERILLRNCKRQLSKLPCHLNIVVGPEDTADVDAALLSRIFTYALLIGIDCISLYDTRTKNKGHITLNQVQEPRELVYSKKLQEGYHVWNLVSTATSGRQQAKTNANGTAYICATLAATGIANGFAKEYCNYENSDKSIKLFHLSAKDGRPLLSDVCRALFQQRQSDDVQALLKDREHLTTHINDELTQRLGKLPDPELSIIFNNHMCTFGLLPWQTRFTEFHQCTIARHFDARSFAQLMYKFSRCEQRWGK